MPGQRNAVRRLLVAEYVLLTVVSLTSVVRLDNKTLALIYLSSGVLSVLLALWLSRDLSLRLRIVALAISYLGLTVSFASLHYLLFLRDPDAYSFAEALVGPQARSTVGAAKERASIEETELRSLNEILSTAKIDPAILVTGKWLPLDSGPSVRVFKSPPPGAGLYVPPSSIEFRSENSTYEIRGDVIRDPKSDAVNKIAFAETAEQLRLGLLDLQRAVLSDRQNDLAVVSRGTPEWGYGEFLYFSSVTMTTLGVGDILPTNAASRFLVSLQAISGVLLVAFALAFLWPES